MAHHINHNEMNQIDGSNYGAGGFFLTMFLYFLSHFTLSDIATIATIFSGFASGIVVIVSFLKKNKKS